MRYTLLLVAALGLIATAAPAVLAQETQPATTGAPAERAPTPALAPTTVAGPIVAAPAISSGCCQPVVQASCCQPAMQTACCQPGAYPYGAPAQTYSSRRGLFRGRNRTNEMPVYASYYTPYQSQGIVTSGVQPVGYSSAACCGGTVMANPPIAGGVMTAGMIAPQSMPGAVVPAGGIIQPTDQPIMTAGYPMAYPQPVDTYGTETARRGLFGRMRR
jgi:hypothetical protein